MNESRIDAIMAIHDMSMSENDEQAAFGRLAKQISEPVLDWLTAECQTPERSAYAMVALISVMSTFLMTLITNQTTNVQSAHALVRIARKMVDDRLLSCDGELDQVMEKLCDED